MFFSILLATNTIFRFFWKGGWLQVPKEQQMKAPAPLSNKKQEEEKNIHSEPKRQQIQKKIPLIRR